MEYKMDAYVLPDDFFNRDEALMQVDGDSDVFTLLCEDARYPEAEVYICCSSSEPEKVFVIMAFENWNRVEDYRILHAEDEGRQLAALIERLSDRLTLGGESGKECENTKKKI